MAHTKAQGSSSNGRDSAGQRRGVKVYGRGRKVFRGECPEGLRPVKKEPSKKAVKKED